MQDHGIHAAHNAANAAHDLRRAVSQLADDESHEDHVGLGTLANLAYVLADGLDRYWWALRPTLDES